ncbi:membrane-bound lytic murein transglycosylase MltF [Desulfitispora alkaliphila]|uniref:lytic transglycosylase domain-containing protein n=1 Tax=Desulfitispora alkaliphila TaxID=622674 RepID=UPI003D22A173
MPISRIIYFTILSAFLGVYLAVNMDQLVSNFNNKPILTIEREPEELVELELFWDIFNYSQDTNPQLDGEDSLIIARAIMDNANKYNLDPGLVVSVIEHESTFNPDAVSHMGAIGLMQIMPNTGKAVATQLGINDYSLYHIEDNIQIGTHYLMYLIELYDNDYHKALTAYNRGPQGLQTFVKSTGTPKSNYSKTILNNY